MPTYTFECKNCQRAIEGWYQMSQVPDAVVCETCCDVADRVISGGQGFLLKGHGWGFDRYAGASNFSNFGKDDNNNE